jgi:hypothetical protein
MDQQYVYLAAAIFVVIATFWVALRPQKPVAALQNKHPSCCPICFSANLIMSTEWAAQSLDPHDKENKCELQEWQCLDPRCSRSFWV